MQLTIDNTNTDNNSIYIIQSYSYNSDNGQINININQQLYDTSILLLPEMLKFWDLGKIKSARQLSTQHFEQLLGYNPEIIILGTGANTIFPDGSQLQAIYSAKIGIEIMDTIAACRTYNILASDQRRVLAALFL